MLAEVLVEKPNHQTVCFAGKFINLSKISRSKDIHISHLSRVFKGERVPSLPQVRKISEALDMTIQEFVDELDKHLKV